MAVPKFKKRTDTDLDAIMTFIQTDASCAQVIALFLMGDGSGSWMLFYMEP